MQTKPEASRRKEILETIVETNGIEKNHEKKKINKTKNWFFEKINKLRLIRKKSRKDSKSEMKMET